MLFRLDPRVVLAWWVCASILILSVKTLTGFLVLTVFLVAFWMPNTRSLIQFSKGVVPFLIFVAILQMGKPPETILLAALRVFLLIGSSFLVITTLGNDRLVLGIKSIKPKGESAMEIPMGLIAFILGQGFMTIPNIANKFSRIVEISKTRGIDPNEGNVFQRAKKYLGLTRPLFISILERNRRMGITIYLMDFSPLVKRTDYEEITMKISDWLTLFSFLLITIIIVLSNL